MVVMVIGFEAVGGFLSIVNPFEYWRRRWWVVGCGRFSVIREKLNRITHGL
ncbi:hypothetical protein HanRHA438_Chr09g0388451 [Helianthus annuus]|nr:hypothetical protein HanRHA438_Chr09g0388451 [Helianthus annuus]